MGVKKPYIYQIGDIVNKTLKIVDKTRMKKGKEMVKGYVVQSVVYPNAPTYKIFEYNLKSGTGCAYVKGDRVCDENSLWSIESIRDNIVDINEAKNISRGNGKKLLFKCANPNCNNTKMLVVQSLVRQGFPCDNCSSNISYPEKFFMAYLEIKGIKYNTQVAFNNSRRRIDFYIPSFNIYVETHGLSHYQEIGGAWKDAHRNSIKSDKIKRKWCKENDKILVELDCRNSNFEFIEKQVNNNKYLPNILPEDKKKIISYINKSSIYDTDKIIKLYTIEKFSTYKIANELGFSHTAIYNVLKRNKIKMRCSSIEVKCIETGKVYSSIKEAYCETGINNTSISRCCKNKQKTAGGYHWEFIYK